MLFFLLLLLLPALDGLSFVVVKDKKTNNNRKKKQREIALKHACVFVYIVHQCGVGACDDFFELFQNLCHFEVANSRDVKK